MRAAVQCSSELTSCHCAARPLRTYRASPPIASVAPAAILARVSADTTRFLRPGVRFVDPAERLGARELYERPVRAGSEAPSPCRSPRLHIEPVRILRGGDPVFPGCDLVRPGVSASRMVLTRDDALCVGARTAWFHLESVLIDSLRPGDTLNMVRTQRGGLGVSVMRGDTLVVAIGVVTAVPTRDDSRCHARRDLLTRIPLLGGGPTPWLSTFQLTTTDPIPRKPRDYSARCGMPPRRMRNAMSASRSRVTVCTG